MSLNGKRLRVFDFCGTIVCSKNTSKLLLEFLSKKGLLPKWKFLYYWILAKAVAYIIPVQYMPIRLRSLSGMLKSDFDESVKEFALTLIRNPLMSERLSCDDVVLSYGLKEVIKAWLASEEILAEVAASELEVVNGVITGRYSYNLEVKGKLSGLRELLDISRFDEMVFYTDDVVADKDVFDAATMTCIL